MSEGERNGVGPENYATQTPTTVRCSQCRGRMSATEFYVDRRKANGLQSACKSCARRAQKRYYQANGQKYRERRVAASRRDREANLEKRRTYRNQNKHVVWESRYRRRCREYGLVPVVVSFTDRQLVERWGEHCVYCSGRFEEIDHIQAVARGGHHTIENVVPVCKRCNQRKFLQTDMPLIRASREYQALLSDTGVASNVGGTADDGDLADDGQSDQGRAS